MDERTQQEFEARRAQWKANGSDEQPRLKPLLWSELNSQPRGEPLIKNLWDKRTMSVIYGDSGSYKTFVGVNLATHVALGRCWRGRRVNGGRVLYIAAEGGGSIERRFTAIRLHLGIEPCDDLAVLPVSVDLCHEDNDADQIIAGARWVFQGDPIVLVIVDTLSRALAGGNENAPDDMGGFVRNCDRIRQETGAHVAAIHHTGKDAAQGARGHSLLRAAVDTEIEVTKDDNVGLVTVTVTKQRDHATGERFVFRPELIELGKDEDEESITSYALVPVDETPQATRNPKLTGPARLGLDELRNCIADAGSVAPASGHIPTGVMGVTLNQWREHLSKRSIINPDGNPREQFRRIRVTLLNAGLIGVWDDFVWTVTTRHKVSP